MKDSAFGRLIGVLVAPGETFRSIAERPAWVAPLIVLVALAVGLQWTVRQRTDMEQAIREQTEAFGLELTQEQIDEQVEKSKNPTNQVIEAVATGVLIPVVIITLGALLLWIGFRMFGSEIRYVSSLSTLLYGLVPLFGVATLLNIPLVLGRETVTMEEMTGGILMSHLGFLAGEDSSMALRGLLQSFDFFSVWSIVLLVIGYRATARVSTATATSIVLAVWLLGVALKVGMMALPALIMNGGGS